MYGEVDIDITLESDVFPWYAYVADIPDDGLIGFDFLHHYDCVLEARRGLRIGKRLYETTVNREFNVCTVYVKSDTIIPANCEYIVCGTVENFEFDCDNPFGIIEPIQVDAPPLHVAHSVVDVARAGSGIPVRVANTNDDDLRVFAGTRIAFIQPVVSIFDVADGFENNESSSTTTKPIRSVRSGDQTNFDSWPEELKDLYARSCKGLDTGERQRLAALLDKHRKSFAMSADDHGRTSIVRHAIDTGNASPIKQRPRRPPRAFEGEEEKIIADQLKAGVIRESSSPWSSPLVYVKKKDGTTRQCVDYRKLNEVTKKDAYPLPRMEDCLDCLGGAQVFSTLDLQSGFWQIEIEEDDRQKTAFSTRNGHYEYVTMPFGLCNAPSTFERAMELLMKGLQWKTLILYLDDIIVMAPSFDDHLTRLDEVLSRLSAAGLKLKSSKCSLFRPEVAYLGHIVSENGIKPDPDKIRRIKNWTTPTSITDVRSFLGLCSYYRRFIRGFSSIAAPLNKLLEKSNKFEWNDDCDQAFDDLKKTLVSDSVMAYPRDSGLFILDTDASATGIGAVLSQLQWDETSQKEIERPIAYASRTLTRSQRRYCTTRRELLAVVSFVRHFRHYLLGRKFLIRTDHSSLRWIMSFREPTDQMARWLEILSQFDFDIEHRAGKKHGNADSLSRMPCDPDSCDCYDGSTILSDLPCRGCITCQRRHREWSDFFSVDDVIPLSSKSVKTIHTNKPGSDNVNRTYLDNVKCSADMIFYVGIVIVFLLGLLSYSLSNLRIGLYSAIVCLFGSLAVVISVTYDAFRFLREGHWPTLGFSSLRVKKCASISRVKAQRSRKNAVDIAQNDSLSCVSETGAVAGDFSGPQGQFLCNIERNEMITKQKNDPDIGIIYEWLVESSDRPDRSRVHDKSPAVRNLWLLWKQLQIIDGVLYKRNYTNNRLTTSLQLVVPATLRNQVVKANHSSKMAGHLGIKKTLSRTSRSFYWFNMKQSVRLFLANCASCGARKKPTTKPRAPLGEYTPGSPMDRVAMDILGPFPISAKGNRYVLVIGDTFTKWIEAYAIADQTAPTIANVVVREFIARFGTPLEIHTDQGKNFESDLMHELCRLLEITKTRTSPYRPNSNGMIERFNKTLVDMITAFVDKKQTNWDENLPLLTSAYRSTEHESTRFSPNFLMLGREVRTPIEVAMGMGQPDDDNGGRLPNEHAVELVAAMTDASKLARDHLGRARERQKKDYDARISVNNFKVGDFVYYVDSTRKKGLSPKLNPHKFVGPCVVVRIHNDVIFEIRTSAKCKGRTLHHDRLKPYINNDIPQWAMNLSERVKISDPNKRQTGTQTNVKDIMTPRRSARTRRPPDRLGTMTTTITATTPSPPMTTTVPVTAAAGTPLVDETN